MKVTFYTRSGTTSPSSNYRIIQYIDEIKNKTENVRLRIMSPVWIYVKHSNATGRISKFIWCLIYYFVIQYRLSCFLLMDILKNTECIVINRAISPKIIFPWNKILLKKVINNADKVIWDFDDDIFSTKEITFFEKELLIREANKIIVTNERLDKFIPNVDKDRIIYMSTTDGEFSELSVEELISKRKETYNEEIRILWLATSSSLPNLTIIEDALERVAIRLKKINGKQLILNVVCNKPFICNKNNLKIINTIWSPEAARAAMIQSHIGIMPLVDNEFNRSKGGFKIIQYMSVAMPTLASKVGYNVDIIENRISGYLINNNDILSWENEILELSYDWNLYESISKNARDRWNKEFSYYDNLDKWLDIINN